MKNHYWHRKYEQSVFLSMYHYLPWVLEVQLNLSIFVLDSWRCLKLLLELLLINEKYDKSFFYFGHNIDHPVDTGRKLNVHKTFRRCPGRPLNVLRTFNLRPVSTGWVKLYWWLDLAFNQTTLFFHNR